MMPAMSIARTRRTRSTMSPAQMGAVLGYEPGFEMASELGFEMGSAACACRLVLIRFQYATESFV